MKLIENVDSENRKRLEKSKSIDWPRYLSSFLAAYVLFALFSHGFFPYPPPASLGLKIYSLSKLVFYYTWGYFFVFLWIHLFLSLPVIVVAKAIPKWRHFAIPFLLYRVLGPTWLIGLAMMYGGQFAETVLP